MMKMRKMVVSMVCGAAALLAATPVFAENTSDNAKTNDLVLVDLTDNTADLVAITGNGNMNTATNAFDNDCFQSSGANNNGRWGGMARPVFVTIQFKTACIVNAYRVWNQHAGWDVDKRAPRDFCVSGSVDGVTWTMLDHRINETGWTDLEPRYYECTNTANTTAYSYYCFSIADEIDNSYAIIQELEYFHVNSDARQLVVTGTPGEFGTVTPAYGTYSTNKASSLTFTAPAAWTNEAGTVAATCTGYKVFGKASDGETWTNETSGTGTTFNYVQPDGSLKVEWQLDATAQVTATAGAGGTVSGSGWYNLSSNATLTATPDTKAFAFWTGDVPASQQYDNPLQLVVTNAMNVSAVFAGTYYVATNGLDTNDGLTSATPFATLSNAVAQAGAAGTIHVAAGTYNLPTEIILTNAVKIIGATGNPADVVMAYQNTSFHRNFRLGNSRALLSGITVQGGHSQYGADDSQTSGLNVYITADGGCVSNCVLSGGNGSVYGAQGGNLWMASGLVTRCVIEGGSISSAGGNVYMTGGRVENCLIRNSQSQGGAYVSGGTFVNCTVVGNDCGTGLSGVAAPGNGLVENCVILGNKRSDTHATKAWSGTAANFVNCALDEAIDGGTACILNPEGFVDTAAGDYHLLTGATCVDAGTAYAGTGATSATDLDGATRVVDVVDIGCYELPEEEKTRPTARFSVSAASGVLPFDVSFTATVFNVSGDITYSWDFGDGTEIVSGPDSFVTHSYEKAGTNDVALTVQGTTPATPIGVTNKAAFYGIQKTLYVASGNAGAAYPYATAETAAGDVGSAVAAAIDGCEVRVASGLYKTTDPVTIEKAILVLGQTGTPSDVVVTNTSSHRVCILNDAAAVIQGLTLAGGDVNGLGGDLWINVLGGTATNCILASGSVNGYSANGGGVAISSADGLVTHCVIRGTHFSGNPGGSGRGSVAVAAYLAKGRLENSLIIDNIAANVATPSAIGITVDGGAIVNCTIARIGGYNASGAFPGLYLGANGYATNCVIVGATNTCAANSAAVAFAGTTNNLVNCALDDAKINDTCVTGAVARMFVDYAGGCYLPLTDGILYNAGTDVGWTASDVGLDGNPRVLDETDIGCYENQKPKGSFGTTVGGNGLFVPPMWITNNLAEADRTSDAAVSNALAAAGANGLARWTSYALGLDPNSATSVVLRDAKQDADPSSVTFCVPGALPPVDEAFGVEYVLEGWQDGAWTDVARGDANALTIGLPTDITRFRIRTEIIWR